jgi:hypothetical protein
MGYSQLHKGYRCLHIPTQRIYLSRHVIFEEDTFPFQPSSSSQPLTILPLQPSLDNLPSLPESTSPPIPFPSPPATSTHHMMTRTKSKSLKPKTFPQHQVYNTSLTSDLEPTCYTHAMKHFDWRKAMTNELTSLAINGTWELVPPPSDSHVIGCKWLFKI